MDTFEWEQLGRTDLLAEGHQLNKAELLFEKIEDETIQAQVDKLLATKKRMRLQAIRLILSNRLFLLKSSRSWISV